MDTKIIKYIFMIILIPCLMYASGGSIYSRFGLGDYFYSFTSRRMAIGELGIALNDFDYLNNTNPASWSKLRLTRVETGLIYHGNNISSSSSSVFYSQIVITGFMLGFPIDHKYGISLTTGLLPFSNIDYDIATKDSSELQGMYESTFSGKGGISKALIGLSYKLPFNFSLGASFDYYLGKITHKYSISFLNNSEFHDGSFSDEYSYYGVGFSAGIITNNLASIINIKNVKDLRLGVTYSSATNLHADTVNNSTTVIGSINNSTGKIITYHPYKLGVGLSLTWNNDYLFVFDYLYQPFSKLRKDNNKIDQLRDLHKFSLGVEYRKDELRSHSFWELIMIRGGLSYEKTQYRIYNTDINMVSLYGGFSIPVGFESTLDLAFQIGKRGTTKNNLLQENIYKLSITLSFGELWFVRQEK